MCVMTRTVLKSKCCGRCRIATCSMATLIMAYITTTVAFTTSFWLESVPSSRLPRPQILNFGLWKVCVDNFKDGKYLTLDGCFYFFSLQYNIIRDRIQPDLIVITQILYVLCICGLSFALILLSIGLLLSKSGCCVRQKIFMWIGIDLLISALLGTIALILFVIKYLDDDFMPRGDLNRLSWSFEVAVIGVFFQFVSGILYEITAKRIARKIEKSCQYDTNGQEANEEAFLPLDA